MLTGGGMECVCGRCSCERCACCRDVEINLGGCEGKGSWYPRGGRNVSRPLFVCRGGFARPEQGDVWGSW